MLKHIHTVKLDTPLALESGKKLDGVEIAVTCFGSLALDKSNVVLVAHALTGWCDATEWWKGVVGPGCVIDTDKYFVVCPNLLGSCYGSTGPESINPATGNPYRSDFPVITVRDIARANLLALRKLGIEQCAIAIGGSMGAMVLLEQAIIEPQSCKKLVLIATGASQSAWRIAFSSVVRKTITSFGTAPEALQRGLALARQLAMTTYRCSTEFNTRFGRERVSSEPSEYHDSSNLFEVESYLEHQGRKIVERFSPHSYLTLTRAMELHDVGRGRGGDAHDVLASIVAETLVIGIDSDMLYPESEVRQLAEAIPQARYQTLNADCGHDSFLASSERLVPLLQAFISGRVKRRPTTIARRRVAV